jgi:hypothetical protein
MREGEMQFYENRLRSFTDAAMAWPHTAREWKATPEAVCLIPFGSLTTQLAKAGFYYDPIPSVDGSDSDRVACYLCNVVLSNWRPGQEPIHRHRQEFVECPAVASQQQSGRLLTTDAKALRRQTFGKWCVSSGAVWVLTLFYQVAAQVDKNKEIYGDALQGA